MADAPDSKSGRGNPVGVQINPFRHQLDFLASYPLRIIY